MTSEVVAEGGPILRLAIVELELALVVVLLSAWTHNLLEVEALVQSQSLSVVLVSTQLS